jgi:hypothetical protein
VSTPDTQHGGEWQTSDRLSDLVRELIGLSTGLFESIPEPLAETDMYGNMGLTFLSKQIDHARSLLALNRSRDSVLIARSMIEGMVQITWASKEPGNRARRWWDFDAIQRWRTLARRKSGGMNIPDRVLAEAERSALRLGRRFLTKKAAARWKRTRTLPKNPYVPTWSGKDMRELCEATRYNDKYLTFYAEFSEWHHWGPIGVGEPLYAELGPVEGRALVGYQCEDPAVTERALANGFQCLAVTLDIMDDHLHTGLNPELQRLVNEYMGTKGGTSAGGEAVQAT